MGYVPYSAGNKWFYNATTNDPTAPASSSFIASFINGTKSVLGVTATALTQQDTSTPGASLDSYYYLSLGGLSYVGNNDTTDLITPQIVPYAQLLFPVQTGRVSSVTGTNLPFGYDGIGNPITLNITQTIDNVAIEAVSVSAGSFSNAMKQVSTISGTARDAALGQSIAISGTATDWLVPGVGLVKQTSSTTVGTTRIDTSQEMRGYTVNGVFHGLGLPLPLASGLAAGDSNLQSPGAPGVASDGSNFLVVSGTVANGTSTAGPILARIMDGQGALLQAITLTPGATPMTAFDGTNYWVAFSNDSVAGAGCHAQRVSTSGAVLDSSPLVVSATSFCGSQQRMAFGGSNGLIVYSHYNMSTSRHDLYGALLNPNGTVGTEFPIIADTSDHLFPVVAFGGTNYIVVWEQGSATTPAANSLYAARISPTGMIVDVPALPVSTNATGQYSASVAFDGSNYLIGWLDLRAQTGTSHADLYANRMSPSGALLDGAATGGGFLISSGATQQLYSPNVAYNGAEFFVSWGSLDYGNQGGLGIQAARVSTTGTLTSGSNIQVSSLPSIATVSRYVYPTFAKSGTSALLVWLDNTEVSGSQKGLAGLSMAPF
ncbi:hypothetical protein GALL_42780 [mine drainage metagenome]|uniref:Uncharacterized protein n=1 Tax=mine drainage metagenome TaxID=410659 RepID=A0A1J5TDS8_9ZZZZ